MKKNDPSGLEGDMLSHLVELRKRFVYSLLFFVVMLVVAFFFVPQLMDFILLTTGNVDLELNIFNVTDSLYLYMRVAGLFAIIVTTPFIVMQIWFFIKPGLKPNEKRAVRKYIPMIVILFFAGISFAYFVIIPYYIYFSGMLATANGLTSVIGAKTYIDFIAKTIWPFGVAFEMPVIIFVLSGIGIINHKMLSKIRGYAYIGLMIISAFLTPPDPISMGILLIPLSILYESSVIIARRNHKRFISRQSVQS